MKRSTVYYGLLVLGLYGCGPEAQEKTWQFDFTDAPVEQVVECYETMAGYKIYGASTMTGRLVSCSSDGPISREEAMQLIQDMLLFEGYIRSRAFEPIREESP